MTRSTLGMSHSWRWPVIGTLLAIASTTVMDAVGLSNFNVFPLIPLFVLFWYLQRMSRAEIGLTWGRPQDYALALFYPVLVIGLIAWLSGAVSTAHTDWTHTWVQLASSLIFTFLIAIVTEEGIFRGWLWATLQRGGVPARGLVVWTSLAFAAWHVSTALLPTQYHPPLTQVPIYLLNVVVIGFTWGLIRQRSGSIVVSAVSHSVWNTLVYVFIGVGTTVGALGIQNSAVFGPELGVLGLALNVAFAAVLWLGFSRGRAIKAIENGAAPGTI